MKKIVASSLLKCGVFVGAVGSVLAFSSCGGGGGGGTTASSSLQTATLYLTDDASYYQAFYVTVKSVSLCLQTDQTCQNPVVLYSSQTGYTVNLTSLSNALFPLSTTNVLQGPYNRLIVNLSQTAYIVYNSQTYSATFASYENPNKPDTVNCSGSSCSIAFNGTIEPITLSSLTGFVVDFNLKGFDVSNTSSSVWTITDVDMSPITLSNQVNLSNYLYKIDGTVSSINSSTIVLNSDDKTFTISYTGATCYYISYQSQTQCSSITVGEEISVITPTNPNLSNTLSASAILVGDDMEGKGEMSTSNMSI